MHLVCLCVYMYLVDVAVRAFMLMVTGTYILFIMAGGRRVSLWALARPEHISGASHNDSGLAREGREGGGGNILANSALSKSIESLNAISAHSAGSTA